MTQPGIEPKSPGLLANSHPLAQGAGVGYIKLIGVWCFSPKIIFANLKNKNDKKKQSLTFLL